MWIETSNEVYAVIFAKHKKDLRLYTSFTDMSGNGYYFSSGHPEVIKEWGFKSAENPLLRIEKHKENESDKDWTVEFFIYCG